MSASSPKADIGLFGFDVFNNDVRFSSFEPIFDFRTETVRILAIIFVLLLAYPNATANAGTVEDFEQLAYDQCFEGVLNGRIRFSGDLTPISYWREQAPENTETNMHKSSQLGVAVGEIGGNSFCEILVPPSHFEENSNLADDLEQSFRSWAAAQTKTGFGSVIKDCSTDASRRDIILESNTALTGNLHLRSFILIYDDQPTIIFAAMLLPKAGSIICN